MQCDYCKRPAPYGLTIIKNFDPDGLLNIGRPCIYSCTECLIMRAAMQRALTTILSQTSS